MYYLDYSNGWPSSQSMLDYRFEDKPNERVGGVIRYVTSPGLMQPPNPGNKKHITRAEYDSHKSAGLDVWLVYQGTTTDADGGFSIGQRNAQRAVEGCNYLGGYNGPIFFTNDRTTLPSPAAWRGYLDGAASVIGEERVGAYGFANAMDAAVGHASWFWQAGRRSDVRSNVHFWQDNNVQVTVGGILCDRNLVLKSGIPIPPPPPPPPPPPEEDMLLTDVVGVINGRTITVRDVFLDQYRQQDDLLSELRSLAASLPEPQRDRFDELCNLLYLRGEQASWADLAAVTWEDLGSTPWGDIPKVLP